MTDKIKPANKNDGQRDPDMVGADAAIKRAAQLARHRAMAAGTGIVVMIDGKIVEIPPDTPV
jgi:hypothetical protein